MRFFLVTGLLVLVGCAASGPAFTDLARTGDNEAMLYVYRPHYFPMRNAAPDVYINGERRASLKDEGFLVFRLVPGRATVEIKGNGLTWSGKAVAITEDFRPQMIYFMRYRSGVSMQPSTVPHTIEQRVTFVLELVPSEQALPELRMTRSSE